MTETTSIPTVAQLEAQQAALTAQQAELDRQMAAASLGSVQAAKAVLDRAASIKIADDLEPLLEQLPANSVARQQITSVITDGSYSTIGAADISLSGIAFGFSNNFRFNCDP